MLSSLIIILCLDILIFGGGGIYFPIFQDLFVNDFHLLTIDQFYNLLNIINIFPGVVGAKLLIVFLILKNDYIFSIFGLALFICIPIFLIIFVSLKLKNLQYNKYYRNLKKDIEPILIGIYIIVGINYISQALKNNNFIMLIILSIITFILLRKKYSNLIILIFVIFLNFLTFLI